MFTISLVMPTFNRGENLRSIIEGVLACNTDDFSEVEIVIVDDGSVVPAQTFLEGMELKRPFKMKVVRQANGGPALARNNGFQQASHETVLFMDDDIIAFPDMLVKHAEGHRQYPGAVIYGYCPYVEPKRSTPAFRFLKQLTEPVGGNNFIPTISVASGNISVEKKMFPDGEFYKSSLRTPAAEEFELMARLAEKQIKIYCNPSIRGWHLQPTTIEDKCKQEFKYGIGVAEVAIKVPHSLSHPNLKGLYKENCEIMRQDSVRVKTKKFFKSILAGRWSRNALLNMTKGFERILPFDRILFPLYRMLAGIFVFAGVREGLKKFQDEKPV